jgi:Tol biopolymer transport system component
VTSDPVPILSEGVRRSEGNHTGAVHAATSSAGGSLIYVPGPLAPSYDLIEIAMVDPASGTVQTLNLPPRRYTFPRFSPDGTHIAFGIDTGVEATIWTFDLAGTSLMQPITGKGKNRFPVWISNKTVAFQSDREGDIAIFQQAANGTGIAERLTKSNRGTAYAPESWTGASNTLMYTAVKGSEVSLWTLSLSDKTATPFDAFPTPNAAGAAFSPDGRMVAYSSLEGGRTTVYVQPFPATGDRYQLTAAAGDGPHGAVWSPNGKTLFYNPRAGGFEKVAVTTNPFRFGNPVAVARKLQMFPPGSRTNYDVRLTDGKFVGLISSGQTAYAVGSDVDIQVVLGFFEDLKARVPRR